MNIWLVLHAGICIHKPSMHGKAIISNFTIPIKQLSEEASKAQNKKFRKYREIHSRKINRVAINEDILHHLFVTSNPVISNFRSKLSAKNKI